MSISILTVEIRFEHHIVLVRQRARFLAARLGFDTNDQTRISTAVSEIARNAFQYAGGGRAEFLIEGTTAPQTFLVRLGDRGPGIKDLPSILEGKFQSSTGMGLGLIGARKLMEVFHIETGPQGTTVVLGKTLPPRAPTITGPQVAAIVDELSRQAPQNPLEELQRQNQELLQAMDELRRRQEELETLNRELADTNRGIVALYAELDEKATHLGRANELKARFLSNMSHEFRTPLNAIISLSRILLERSDGPLTDEQEKQVTFIRKAAEDLSSLVNDLLDLAKIEAGKTIVHASEFDISTLFSALRGMIRPLLVNPAVNLVFEEPERLKTMISDEGKISQILRNLLSNAIKFTERGEIRLTATPTPDGASVIFTVSDTGIGIPEEYQSKIFEEYVQVDSPLHKKYKGTGLGLSLSRKLAELLGGSLTCQSIPGQGSTFSATLPLIWTPPGEERIQEAATPPRLDPTRYPILVVEDDEATIALYEKFLKASGFQVLPARTLAQARRCLTEVTPLAIILDLLLEGATCWEFLGELRAQEATRDIPIFVASVLEDQARGFSLGATDFATKPVERKWLLSRLSQVMRRRPVEKALIIDDEEIARYILKGILAATRFTILEAADGETGLQLARTERPQIIFLDLCMPGMDGFTTLLHLRQDPTTADIPVFIVTSKHLTEAEKATLHASAATLIPKNLSGRDEVLSRIREALSNVPGRPARRG